MELDRLDILLGLVQTREWGRAWAEFQRLREEEPQSPRLMYLGSLVAYGQRDLFRARNLIDTALDTVSASDPPKLVGQIRFHLGMVARELGDTHVALEQFKRFIADMPEQYPELALGEGNAYFNLGLTLRQRREMDEAVAAYQKAITCFRRDALPSSLFMALINLAWLYCQGQRPADARECLLESRSLASTHENHLQQTLGEAYLAVTEGAYPLASELSQEIFLRVEHGEPVTAEIRSQAAWIAGQVAMEQGSLGSAAALADIALNYGAEAKDSRLVNDAAALRREVLLRQQRSA